MEVNPSSKIRRLWHFTDIRLNYGPKKFYKIGPISHLNTTLKSSNSILLVQSELLLPFAGTENTRFKY
jgi:hypothetical protein